MYRFDEPYANDFSFLSRDLADAAQPVVVAQLSAFDAGADQVPPRLARPALHPVHGAPGRPPARPAQRAPRVVLLRRGGRHELFIKSSTSGLLNTINRLIFLLLRRALLFPRLLGRRRAGRPGTAGRALLLRAGRCLARPGREGGVSVLLVLLIAVIGVI